ncbi:unnamed protein product, partial [Porites lobata]
SAPGKTVHATKVVRMLHETKRVNQTLTTQNNSRGYLADIQQQVLTCIKQALPLQGVKPAVLDNCISISHFCGAVPRQCHWYQVNQVSQHHITYNSQGGKLVV